MKTLEIVLVVAVIFAFVLLAYQLEQFRIELVKQVALLQQKGIEIRL